MLGGRGAALVEGVGGDLGGAGHRVAVDSAVELDHCGFGGHGDVAVLRRPVIAVKQNQETPVELRGRERNTTSTPGEQEVMGRLRMDWLVAEVCFKFD